MLCLHCEKPVDKNFYIVQAGICNPEEGRRALSSKGLFLCGIVDDLPSEILFEQARLLEKEQVFYRFKQAKCQINTDGSINYSLQPRLMNASYYADASKIKAYLPELRLDLFQDISKHLLSIPLYKDYTDYQGFLERKERHMFKAAWANRQFKKLLSEITKPE